MAMAPLERQTETIIGSISGVNPTATDKAKRKACFQSCLVRPLMTKHQRHHDRHETQHQPGESLDAFVETGLHRLAADALGDGAQVSLRAGLHHQRLRRAALHARAQKTKIGIFQRRNVSSRVPRASNFSTGSDSPVNVAWMMNKSLARQQPHVRRDHVAGGKA